MTRDEKSALEVFLGEWRQYREDDRVWKQGIDVWRRNVEAFIVSERTKDDEVRTTGMTRRARVALFFTALGVTVSTVFGAINVFTALT